MSRHYGDIAFTPAVTAVQSQYGSAAPFARSSVRPPDRNDLTDRERAFLSERDGFYLATVSETGWPYVQFRGGPPGFLRVLDGHTIGWADFRGNQQYISTGNLASDGRVSIIAVDYAQRRRLKLFGQARVTTVEQDAALVDSLGDGGYEAVLQRAVVVSVEAFDWNCPQHIPTLFSTAEIAPVVTTLQDAISDLQSENEDLRRRLGIA